MEWIQEYATLIGITCCVILFAGAVIWYLRRKGGIKEGFNTEFFITEPSITEEFSAEGNTEGRTMPFTRKECPSIELIIKGYKENILTSDELSDRSRKDAEDTMHYYEKLFEKMNCKDFMIYMKYSLIGSDKKPAAEKA
jgi:hypothetical protein